MRMAIRSDGALKGYIHKHKAHFDLFPLQAFSGHMECVVLHFSWCEVGMQDCISFVDRQRCIEISSAYILNVHISKEGIIAGDGAGEGAGNGIVGIASIKNNFIKNHNLQV